MLKLGDALLLSHPTHLLLLSMCTPLECERGAWRQCRRRRRIFHFTSLHVVKLSLEMSRGAGLQ